MPRLRLLSGTCRNIFPPLILAGVPLFAHVSLQGRLQRLVRVCWQPGWPHHDKLIMRTHLAGSMPRIPHSSTHTCNQQPA